MAIDIRYSNYPAQLAAEQQLKAQQQQSQPSQQQSNSAYNDYYAAKQDLMNFKTRVGAYSGTLTDFLSTKGYTFGSGYRDYKGVWHDYDENKLNAAVQDYENKLNQRIETSKRTLQQSNTPLPDTSQLSPTLSGDSFSSNMKSSRASTPTISLRDVTSTGTQLGGWSSGGVINLGGTLRTTTPTESGYSYIGASGNIVNVNKATGVSETRESMMAYYSQNISTDMLNANKALNKIDTSNLFGTNLAALNITGQSKTPSIPFKYNPPAIKQSFNYLTTIKDVVDTSVLWQRTAANYFSPGNLRTQPLTTTTMQQYVYGKSNLFTQTLSYLDPRFQLQRTKEQEIMSPTNLKVYNAANEQINKIAGKQGIPYVTQPGTQEYLSQQADYLNLKYQMGAISPSDYNTQYQSIKSMFDVNQSKITTLQSSPEYQKIMGLEKSRGTFTSFEEQITKSNASGWIKFGARASLSSSQLAFYGTPAVAITAPSDFGRGLQNIGEGNTLIGTTQAGFSLLLLGETWMPALAPSSWKSGIWGGSMNKITQSVGIKAPALAAEKWISTSTGQVTMKVTGWSLAVGYSGYEGYQTYQRTGQLSQAAGDFAGDMLGFGILVSAPKQIDKMQSRIANWDKPNMPITNLKSNKGFYRAYSQEGVKHIFYERVSPLSLTNPKSWLQYARGYKPGQLYQRQYQIMPKNVMETLSGIKGHRFPEANKAQHQQWFKEWAAQEYYLPQTLKGQQVFKLPKGMKGDVYAFSATTGELPQGQNLDLYFSGKGVSGYFWRLSKDQYYYSPFGKSASSTPTKPTTYAIVTSKKNVVVNPSTMGELKLKQSWSDKLVKTYFGGLTKVSNVGELQLPVHKIEVESMIRINMESIGRGVKIRVQGWDVPINPVTTTSTGKAVVFSDVPWFKKVSDMPKGVDTAYIGKKPNYATSGIPDIVKQPTKTSFFSNIFSNKKGSLGFGNYDAGSIANAQPSSSSTAINLINPSSFLGAATSYKSNIGVSSYKASSKSISFVLPSSVSSSKISNVVSGPISKSISQAFSPGTSRGFSPGTSTGFSPGVSNPISPGISTPISPGISTPISPGISTPFQTPTTPPFKPIILPPFKFGLGLKEKNPKGIVKKRKFRYIADIESAYKGLYQKVNIGKASTKRYTGLELRRMPTGKKKYAVF